MKHIFIVNPVAGKNDIIDVICNIYTSCEKNGLVPDLEITKDVGDAKRKSNYYATQNEECVIYSVGGDGTLNEVINGIANTNATLGVIPTGSGNDFYRMLSNSKEDALERTIEGTVDQINLGKANDNYFINIASIGYDAEVAANVWMMKNREIIPNNMIYYASIFYTLFTFKHPKVQISFNDMSLEQQITLLAICNGRYYGNGVPIAPRANISDDVFDIYLADKINKARIPLLLTKVLKGEHEQFDFVHNYQTDYIKVASEEPIHCNIDGEIITSDNFEFSIVKDKMKVLRPKKTTL